jgi:hypothetical protein
MKTTEILDPCTSPHWMEFVNRHPDAGIFHHPCWLGMLSRVYGYKVFALCLKDGDCIEAGMPFVEVKSYITGHRWVSVPFSDHCQPLLGPSGQEDILMLMDYLRSRQGVDTPTIEIRWGIEAPVPLHREGDFVSHSLELRKDTSWIFSTFKKTQVQQPILKASREGVQVRQCTTRQDFLPFYQLQVKTRRRLGVPAQPGKFFSTLWDSVLARGFGFGLVAYKDGQPIAGGVFLKFKGTVTYKYGASDYKYRGFKPNDLILWEAIQRACSESYEKFDFGRTNKNNTGLRKFKSGWGTIEQNLDYTILARRSPRRNSSFLHELIAVIIRHSPQFVCKLTGELLYKHFG